MRIRNPKNEDLGDLLFFETKTTKESLTLEDGCHLFGGKELLVQAHHETLIPKTPVQPGMYNLLVREWNPDTWAFGKLHEVQIERKTSCAQLADFLQAMIFPHIEKNHLFATKVDITRPFKRSVLALKKWLSLAPQRMWIGASSLQINRDSLFIVVKDQTKQLRHLKLGEDDALIRRYADDDYMAHLLRKAEVGADYGQSRADALFDAADANTAYSVANAGKNRREEKAVTIRTDLAFSMPVEEKKPEKKD